MQRRQDGPEQVAQEVLVRPERHAVAHPRTVMVHAHDTPAADAAVVRPRRLHTVALAAVTEI